MIETLDLETKVQELFPGATLKKSLAKFNAQFRQQYPRCVIDYLIAKLGVDPDNPGPGLGKIERLMRDHSVEVGQAELTKSRIRESPNRQHVVFGNVRVRYQDHTDRYLAEVPSLDDQNIRVSRHLIEDFGPVLLTSGAWGKYTIAYAPEEKVGRRGSPFEIIGFEPMQITAFSTDYVIARRDAFTADEWIDLLITSLGFNPSHLSAGTKMLYLARLIVLVEPNVNIVELGPPETAKTYTYRLSPYTHIIQGSNTTVPSLFCNNRSHKVGIMGHRDCVVFDEIAHANDKEMDEVFGMLQCYMNDGTFARDNRQYVSECGVVFLGNIPTNRETRAPEGYHRHLFMPLPVAMRKEQDGAFLDRVHGFIPGWEAPQITTNSYATGYGLMAAYLAEFLHQMRRRNYQYIVTDRVDFKGMGQRSATAVTRLASGLLKLVYPHRDVDVILPEELDWALAEAVKLRQLVLNQLAVIAPGEFAGVKLNYEIQ